MEETNHLDSVSVRLNLERRYYSEEPIIKAEDAVNVVAGEMATWDREVFCILNLDVRHKPINFSLIGMGGATTVSMSMPEMLKSSLLSNASDVIVLHNHPAGTLDPSSSDVRSMMSLEKAFSTVGIQMIDTIIVAGRILEGCPPYKSFMKEVNGIKEMIRGGDDHER